MKGLLPSIRFRSAFRSRLRALGCLAVPPGRYVIGALSPTACDSTPGLPPASPDRCISPGPASQPTRRDVVLQSFCISFLMAPRGAPTHRYVITLVALGHLKQGAERKYRLGMRVVDLGLSVMASTKLKDHAQPFLADLHRRSRYTVALAVLDGPSGQQLIDLDQTSYAWLPVHCTAFGKLLLANLPDAEHRRVIGELTLTKHTSQTITSKTALRAELLGIRGQSLATAEEELVPGMYSIAAPIRSESREVVAAIGMDAHASMIAPADFVEALGPHLVSAADQVSARLGHRRDDELPSASFNGNAKA